MQFEITEHRPMSKHTALLIIDPQNDFCDLPADWCPTDPASGTRCAPALPVPGAHADLQRLAAFIDRVGHTLQDITVTLDSHHRHDIAHPGFWQCRDGSSVAPFTPITAAQVRASEVTPREASALPRTLAYLDELEARGRYTLMVWPVHCEIGSWGHNVHSDLRAAYNSWETRLQRSVAKITKGENPWTEHYSAVLAEVPDPDDNGTQLNQALLHRLAPAGHILIAGEASSHCVKATTEDIVTHLPGGRPGRLTLLTDAMSPVNGFQAQHEAFLADMRSRGVQLATCGQALAQLQARAAA